MLPGLADVGMPLDASMSPERFGKYEVIAQIGEGGFGTVYRGRDPDLKRLVAIKTLSTLQPGLAERFLREAEIAASLQHPSITTIFDFGTEGGHPYLVQEYLTGEDLDAVIARQAPPGREELLGWLIQIAEALEFAHSRGIVHRDVKPANVRVVDDGRVKIMDFGIAKLLSVDDGLTRTGMTLGTAGYLPPEQLRGEAVDRRADIFSFGILAYEVLAGRRPFAGDSVSALFYQIAHVAHPPLAEAWPGCPPHLATTIDRCLAKDRTDRFPDLGPVIAELRKAQSPPEKNDTETVDLWRVVPTRLVETAAASSPEPETGARSGADRTGRHDTYRTALTLPRRAGAYGIVTLGIAAAVAAALWLGWDRRGGGPSPGATPFPEVGGPTPGADRGGEGKVGGDAGILGAGDLHATGETAPTATTTLGVSAPAPLADGSPAGRAPRPKPAERASAAGRSPSPPPRPNRRLLLVVSGEPGAAARTAETTLLRELHDRGFEAISPGGGGASADLAGSDTARLAAAGRRLGASVVVAAIFQGEAAPSAGRFYTGRAVLEFRSYRAADGALLGAGTAEVGSGGARGAAAPSELTALNDAAVEVGRRTADELLAQGALPADR